MLGPPKLRLLDQPVTVSREDLVPTSNCYRTGCQPDDADPPEQVLGGHPQIGEPPPEEGVSRVDDLNRLAGRDAQTNRGSVLYGRECA